MEECDECNDKFSKTIEPDIIQYLALFRIFYDVKGKGGSKKFKGDNFEIKNDGNVELKFYSADDLLLIHDKVKLDGKETISLQNIYRSLCKFFLSVIDSEHLPAFTDTIKWINHDLEVAQLPKMGQLISYHGFTKQPKLVTYRRKTDDINIPYAVGEFYFTCVVIVFILPFTTKDEKDFTSESDYEYFWDTFQHSKRTDGWEFIDFSNDTKKKSTININFSSPQSHSKRTLS